jgi:hypothetical protein
MNNSNGYYSEKYMSMEQFGLNWIFQVEDVVVDEKDLSDIKPLSSEYSSLIWEKFISRKKQNIASLEQHEWPMQLKKQDYNWMNDWNNNNLKGLSNFILNKVNLYDNDIIIFYWMKGTAVETTWRIFLNNWINFLFESEGNLLVCFRKGDSIRFDSSGNFYVGKRKVIE